MTTSAAFCHAGIRTATLHSTSPRQLGSPDGHDSAKPIAAGHVSRRAAPRLRQHRAGDRASAFCSERLPGVRCALARGERADAPVHALLAGVLEALWGDPGPRVWRPAYFALHQVTVDTYAVQHPGIAERRTIQSVGLHLMTLCLVLEAGADPREGPKLHKRMVQSPPFEWLDPPPMGDRLKVVDVLPARSPAEHERLVHAWARDVWEAWTAHHDTVRGWVRHSLS